MMPEIQNVGAFDKALEYGPYAWPGGYQMYFVTSDGGALSFKAAEENAAEIREAITARDNSGWRVVAVEINWEDPALYCDHTGARIPSAYAEDEANDNQGDEQ